MSFDIFVTTLTRDKTDTFDRAIVEQAFRDIAINQTGDYWNLRTPDGEVGFATISVQDKPKISGFAANRPPSYTGFPKFWDSVYEILSQTRTILFWAGDGPHPRCCVANVAVLSDLPQHFSDNLNHPTIVSSGAEIDAAIALTGH